MGDAAVRRGRELRRYAAIVQRWLWLIVACVVCASGVAYGVSKLQKPIYRASTLLIVDQQDTSGSIYNALLASDQLVSTYLNLIKEPAVLQQAAAQVGGVSADDLANRVTVTNPGTSTQLIEIQVDDPSAARAAALANAIAAAFIQVQQQTASSEFQSAEDQLNRQLASEAQQIASLTQQIDALQASNPQSSQLAGLRSQLATAQSQESATQSALAQLTTQALIDTNTIRVFQSASPPASPYSPRPTLAAAIAAAAGLVVAVGLVLLFELLDDRIRTSDEAHEITDLPILGSLPIVRARSTLLVKGRNGRLQECLRVIRTNLNFVSLGQPARILVVTSALPNEGKTTLAINLATALAEIGKRVVLVDADLRRPAVHKQLGIGNRGGLSLSLLDSHQPIDLAAVPSAPGLRILTAGPQPPNPSEMAGSPQMRALLTSLVGADGSGQGRAEIIVVDTPPAAVFPDAARIASVADATILVLDRTRSRQAPVRRMLSALEQVHAHMAGVVVNRVRRISEQTYYYDNYQETGGMPAVPSMAPPISQPLSQPLAQPPVAQAPTSAPLSISDAETSVMHGASTPKAPKNSSRRGPDAERN